MGKYEDKWSISQEREFIENLLNQRFNFFLLFFSIIIAGIISAKTQLILIIVLLIGFVVCMILMATLIRAQQKLDIILEMLFSDSNHPVAIINEQAKSGFSARKGIGYFIPIFCCIVLGVGVILSIFGILKPQC